MENYIQQKADINSFGKVIAIGDGVARVFGLSDVQAGETVFKKSYDLGVKKKLSLWETKRETVPIFRFVSTRNPRNIARNATTIRHYRGLREILAKVSQASGGRNEANIQAIQGTGKLAKNLMLSIRAKVKTLVDREDVELTGPHDTFPVTVEEVTLLDIQELGQAPEEFTWVHPESSEGNYQFTQIVSLKKGSDYAIMKGGIAEALQDGYSIAKAQVLGDYASENVNNILLEKLLKANKSLPFLEGSKKEADSMQIVSYEGYHTVNAAESYFLESAHRLPSIIEKFENSMEKSSWNNLDIFSEKLSNQLGKKVIIKSISEKEALLYCKSFTLDWEELKNLLMGIKSQGYTSLTIRIVKDSAHNPQPLTLDDDSSSEPGVSIHLTLMDILSPSNGSN